MSRSPDESCRACAVVSQVGVAVLELGLRAVYEGKVW